MDPLIVSCLCGMNISCWSHMLDWQQKKFELPKYNIMSLGGPNVSLAWAVFFNETQNAENGG
jgi:hypothetical protein